MNEHDNDRDARFDAGMRRLHGDAVRRVPGRTLLQLQLRPSTGASRQAKPGGRLVWPLTASVAALLALAVGMQLQLRHDEAAPAPAMAAASADDLDTVLDENPDFYLWLASSDANAIAME
jgi:hypothetical protein